MSNSVVGLGLFSGGLDSILACRVVEAQGIKVIGIKFVTPFFDYDLLGQKEKYQAEVFEKYRIKVELVDVSEGYMNILERPAYGFGKNFNPCVDCKILMMTRARKLMKDFGASFLISGEVLGQRPMSQRRDTLRVIERDSGCSGILLRPLSAKNLAPTKPELEGIIDRTRLYNFSGRGRKPQIKLAKEFGIADYPNAAGGCVLTDKNLAKRMHYLYSGKINLDKKKINANDIHCLLTGRQFIIDGKYWVIVGRDSADNERITALFTKDDWLFNMTERPGPIVLLKNAYRLTSAEERENLMKKIGSIVVRYGKQVSGTRPPAEVEIDTGEQKIKLVCAAFTDDQLKKDQIA